MDQIRILREDINLKSRALEEALGAVTPEERFDPMAAAREGLIRTGDMKPSVNFKRQGLKESTIRKTARQLRESIK